jgi:hypothetical protein
MERQCGFDSRSQGILIQGETSIANVGEHQELAEKRAPSSF